MKKNTKIENKASRNKKINFIKAIIVRFSRARAQ